MMDLHAKIMNIQIDPEQLGSAVADAILNFKAYHEILLAVYRRGHRDARHEAAKLVLKIGGINECR